MAKKKHLDWMGGPTPINGAGKKKTGPVTTCRSTPSKEGVRQRVLLTCEKFQKKKAGRYMRA